MKALTAGFDKSGGAMQTNKQKADLLNRQLDLQKQKLAEQKHMLEESSKAFGENSNKTLRWQQAVHDSEAAIAELEGELAKIPNTLQVVGEKLKSLGSGMQTVGRNLTQHITLPLVGIATASAKVTMDFDTAMSRVSATSGATGADLDRLREKAIEMGESTVFSASESADALNYMAMAGWKTEDMLSGIAGVMNLAAAGGEDLATTSDIVTDALTAFGETAEESGRLADIMAAAASNSNTNIAMMGETFRYAAPIAGTLGYRMEDLAIATGLMANAGVKATNAGTALRAGLTRLATQPKPAADAMNRYGISVTEVDGSMKSLGEVMDIIREKLGGLAEDEQAAALKAIFGQNAISGWAAVLNASEEDFNNLSSAINNSNGSAERMAETMRDNLAGEIKLLKSDLESAGITFGEIIMPYLREGVKKLKTLVDRVKKMNPENQKLLVHLLGIAAVAGPLLSIIGKFTSTIGTITNTIGTLAAKLPSLVASLTAQTTATTTAAGAQLALNTAMMAFPLVAAGIIAAVAGIAAAEYGMKDAANTTADEFNKIHNIGEDIKGVSKNIQSGMDSMSASLNDAGKEAKATATEARNAADRLLGLASSGDTSKDAIAGMEVAVAQLNRLFPELGLEIDSTTGALNKSDKEINNYISSFEKMQKVDTATDKIQIALDGVADSTADLTDAQYKLDEALAEQSHIQEMADGIYNLRTQYDDGKISLEEYRTGLLALDSDLALVNGEMISYRGEVSSAVDLNNILKEQASQLNEKVIEGRDAVSAATTALESARAKAEQYQAEKDALIASEQAATEAVKNEGVALDEYSTKTEYAGTKTGELSAHQQQMADTAVASMTQMQDSVTQALGSQMNMFEEFDQKSAMSTTQLLDNMQSQIDGVTQWEENLAELADKGINQELLQKLAAMGPEGAGYVETFNQMSTEELSKANELWLQGLDIQGFGNQAALELQDAVGQLSVGTEAAWTQLGADMGIKAKTAGGYIAPGLIEGMQANQETVTTAATDLGDDTIDALDLGLGVNSPSWKAKESGMYTDEGLANGITGGKPLVLNAINVITNTLNTSFLQRIKSSASQYRAAGLGLSNSLAQGVTSGRGQVQSAVSGINSALQSGLNTIRGQQGAFQSAGLMLSMGMAAGIASGQSAVVSAAAALAAAAVSAAMSALQIHSPSRVAERQIGWQFTAGIARGIDKGNSTVLHAVDKLTNNMISAPSFTPAFAGGGNINTMEYGGTTINVYGAEGQDVDELAELVSEKIDDRINEMERVWGS